VALVAFLAAHAGRPQTRQRIAGLFWPDSTDAQALTNLRRELHQLRHVLGDDEASLVVTSTDLSWQDTETCRVDVRTFTGECDAAERAEATGDTAAALTHATTALAAYRGGFLPGGYDDWLIEVRSELERRCVDLCDFMSQASMRTGDLATAVSAARRRIQLQPLEEIGYRTLMQLQADLGDRAGAVSTYHHCASVLDRPRPGNPPDPRAAAGPPSGRVRRADRGYRSRALRACRRGPRRSLERVRIAPDAVAERRLGSAEPGPGAG
jgi:DNA-binding SARP family transcriptional activator